jgi:hypothetical protein
VTLGTPNKPQLGPVLLRPGPRLQTLATPTKAVTVRRHDKVPPRELARLTASRAAGAA